MALVLAGGGSRGFAHIGVIEALEKEGIEPDIVVGTSMGSVIGGFYSAGMNGTELENMALKMDWDVLFNDRAERTDKFITQKKGEENHIFEFRFRGGNIVIPTALISGQLLVNFLLERTLAADHRAGFDFDSLPRRYRALATDLITGESVVLGKGCLAEAMRASLAVPFAFTPFQVEGRVLIDGGFRNILPVDVARSMGAEVIIAVDIRPVLYTQEELKNPLFFIDQVVAICLLNQEGRPARDSAVVVRPDLGRKSSLDFTGIQALIAAGREAANLALPRIRASLGTDLPALAQGETLSVQSIKIENLRTLSYNDVSSVLNLTPGCRLTPGQAAEAAERVYGMGFFDSAWVEIRDVPSGSALVFGVMERPAVGKVRFAGNTVFSDHELAEVLPLRGGMPDNPALLKKGIAAIEGLYRDKGFALAVADPERTGDGLLVRVREGRIEGVEIRGNAQTGETVILRETGMRKGALFSVRQMSRDVRNLYATGLFESVYINLDDRAGGMVAVIHVKEKASESFKLGLRYDTVRMLEGFVRFGSLNLARQGYALNGTLHYGLRREKYLLSMRMDRLFYTYLTSEGNLYYYRDRKYLVDEEDSTRFTYNTLRKVGGFFTVAHQILKAGKLSWIFLIEHYKSNHENGDIGPLKIYQGVRVLSMRAEFDTYDAPNFPTRGFKFFNNADFGLDVIGRHDAFFDYTVTGAAALTPFKGHTFLPALYMSMADVTLPDPQKNYLGGATELRMNDDVLLYNSFPLFGYPEQSFTGDYLIALRLSYRLNLPRDFYFTLHGNLGNTWANEAFAWKAFPGNFLDESFKGAGVTLTKDIPRVGPAQFTASLPLMLETAEQRRQFSETYYFSIGYDF